jgi:hypothetical protein
MLTNFGKLAFTERPPDFLQWLSIPDLLNRSLSQIADLHF